MEDCAAAEEEAKFCNGREQATDSIIPDQIWQTNARYDSETENRQKRA